MSMRGCAVSKVYQVSNHANATHVPLSAHLKTVFQVNFDGAFMGKVTTEADSTLPAYFLATRLLPCSSFDALKKFTGNKSVLPPTDAISKAIHAFAHYSLLYTKGYLVLCDLQGFFLLYRPDLPSHSHFRHLPR